MPIAHRDFVPEDETQSLDWTRRFEPVESMIERVNRWMADNHGIDVFHIETLVLPASVLKKGEGATPSDGLGGPWFQVIRVWYRS